MYQLAWSQSFKRAFKKAAKNNQELQMKIFSELIVLIDIGKYDEVY